MSENNNDNGGNGNGKFSTAQRTVLIGLFVALVGTYITWSSQSIVHLLKQDAVGPRYTAVHAERDRAQTRALIDAAVRAHDVKGGHSVMESRMDRVERMIEQMRKP